MTPPVTDPEQQERPGCGFGCLTGVAAVVMALVILPAWVIALGGTGRALAQPRASQPTVGGYVWPVAGTITDTFGYRPAPEDGHTELHTGIDIAATAGTPIQAVAAGFVSVAEWTGNYGNLVVIQHGGWETWYGHLSAFEVTVGQSVSAGQVIGLVGSTGRSTGPHVHLEVRTGLQNAPIDPRSLFPQ